MDKSLIAFAGGALIAGLMGGTALGHFATGGNDAAMAGADRGAYAYRDPEPAVTSDTYTSTAPETEPEEYVCRGCGPTLAEKRLYASYGADAYDKGYPPKDPSEQTPPEAAEEPEPIGPIALN